jgi:hypothetical protein
MALPKDVQGAISERIRISDAGCWEWTGYISKSGYGRVSIHSKYYAAHRISYEIRNGPIPDGLVIDHLCRNTRCVNPDHLEAVTQKINVLRGISNAAERAAMTHCAKGHPIDGVRFSHGRIARVCRVCKNENERNRKKRLIAKGINPCMSYGSADNPTRLVKYRRTKSQQHSASTGVGL